MRSVLKTWGLGMLALLAGGTLAIGYEWSDYEWHEYDGHVYALTLATDYWQQVEDEAQSLKDPTGNDAHAHLVTINDADERDWLSATFPYQEPYHPWIGLWQDADDPDYREPGEPQPPDYGGWKWSSGEPVTYTNWVAGEPNNLSGHDDRAQMNAFVPGGWQDVPGEQFAQRGIIEVRGLQADLLVLSSEGAIDRYDSQTGALVAACPSDPNLDARMTIGPDGYVYISEHGQDRVSKYDVDTCNRSDLDAVGPGGALDGSVGLDSDDNDDLWVVSGHTYNVLHYDASGPIPWDLAEPPISWTNPWGLTFDVQEGGIYAGSPSGNTIGKWDRGTSSWAEFVPPGSGGLSFPEGLTFGSDGNSDGRDELYVCSYSTDEILRFDGATGDPLPAPGKSGALFAAGNGLVMPQDLAFGPDGNLYVVSSATDGVLRYDGTTGDPVEAGPFAGAGSSYRSLAFISPPDCNENGIHDAWDISQGTSQDCNSNGVPDECEPDYDDDGDIDDCDPDIDNDGVLNEEDVCDYTPIILPPELIEPDGSVKGDLDGDCDVDLDDFSMMQERFTGPNP